MHLYGSECMLDAKNVSEKKPSPSRACILKTQRTTNLHHNAVFVPKGRERPDSSFSSYRTYLHFKPWREGGERCELLSRSLSGSIQMLQAKLLTLLTGLVTGPVTWIFCTNSWVAFSKKTLSRGVNCFLPAYIGQMQEAYSRQHISHFNMTIYIIYQHICCLHRCELFTWKIDLSIR